MKKIVCIFSVLVLCLVLLCSCSNANQSSVAQDFTQETGATYEKPTTQPATDIDDLPVTTDISLKTEKDTYSTGLKEITFTLTNNSNTEYRYGDGVTLQVEKDGKWTYVPAKLYVNDIGRICKGGETKTITSSFGELQNPIEKGKHRILKTFTNQETKDVYCQFAEFVIE